MTDPLDRVRRAALVLPEATEQVDGAETAFLVAGEPFARVRSDGTMLSVRTVEGGDWETIALDADVDWTLVEDRIARSWELAAPGALLEAGGR